MGTKKTAPPTPDAIAIVAIAIEIGNINQLSNDILNWIAKLERIEMAAGR